MAIRFKDNPNLGECVQDIRVFCKLMKDMPVPTYEYVVGEFNNPKMHSLAGHKWSRLCGFIFKSNKKELKFPNFQFVYVPKLRGALTRNWNGLHGWYSWMYVGADNKKVVSIEDMMKLYGFSINDFVHSDLFEQWIPKFVANIQHVLDNQMQQLISQTLDPDKKQELLIYATAIKKSLLEIYKVQDIVHDGEYKRAEAYQDGIYSAGSTPKPGHAKIAYNADKTYGLKNIDAPAQVEPNADINKIEGNASAIGM